MENQTKKRKGKDLLHDLVAGKSKKKKIKKAFGQNE